MRSTVLTTIFCVCIMSVSCMAAEQGSQSSLNLAQAQAQATKNYPRIVLYSVAWCSHCKEAKEYFTSKMIPFINRDVEVDKRAMEELTEKYNSQGVPVIVIGTGNNEVVVKGFTPELFQASLKKAQAKK